MANEYISQVTLPNNTTYDFTDQNLKVYSGTCETAAATAIKDVTCHSSFVLEKGAVVFVTFTSTNSAAVANLKLRVNSNVAADAKPIKYLLNANDPANIPGTGYLRANQTYMFRYDGTNWVTDLNYDTNTNNFANQIGHYNNILARQAIAAESLIVGDATGYEKVGSGVTFNLAYPIVWCTTAVSANSSNYNAMYLQHYDRNIATGAKSGFASSANKAIYLIVTINGDIATIDENIITDTLPDTDDGKVYISLGKLGAQSTGSNYFFLYPVHPMFWYKNGSIKMYSGASEHALTANSLATSKTIWGQSFDGSANITGSMTNVGPNMKLPANQSIFSFYTSSEGAAHARFGRLGLNSTYANIDINNYTLDVGGKTRISDTIYRANTASNNTPMIWMNSSDYDNWLWQIGSGTTNSMYYGYGLKYIGSGSGAANYLRLYADNQNSTEIIALGINQSGQVGIGTDANTSYRLYVNGASYFNDAVTVKDNSISMSRAGEIGIEVDNTQSTNPNKVAFIVGSSGNGGIYSRKHSKWIVYADASGNVVLNGNANTATSAGKWTTARNISISDSDGTNTGTAVSVDGSAAATLKLPATIKASLTGNADTATSLTNFVVSTYTIAANKGVRIKYPAYAPVLISCQRSTGGSRLILIGGGYGEEGTVRNDFTELVSPSESHFTWSMPQTTGYACTIEIMHHDTSGTATIWVESTAACTFTEITALTSTKTNRNLLHSANTSAGANNNATLTWNTTYTIAKINDTDIKFTTMAKPTYAFSDLTSHPTTLSGYGITDAASSGHDHDTNYVKKITSVANSLVKFTDTNSTIASSGIIVDSNNNVTFPAKVYFTGLGEGLEFTSNNNYFGSNYDARIISIVDINPNANSAEVDGGLIIQAVGRVSGVDTIQELLRIRNHHGSADWKTGEFQWKTNDIVVETGVNKSWNITAARATGDGNGNTITSTYAPLASPALTGTPTAPTAANGTNTTQIATTAFVNNTLSYINAMKFKGTLGTGGTITALPASHEAGDTYRVITAGTWAGKYCEVGTLIICIADGTTAADADWTSVETNEDGAVIGPAGTNSSTDNAIVRWDGTSGRIIQNSKVTIDDNGNMTVSGTALKITATSGQKYILIGNQDSGGTNKPAIIQAANGSLSFGTGTDWSSDTGGTLTTTLFMNSNNNVGIGNTSPNYKLDVKGGIMAVNTVNNTDGLIVGIETKDYKFGWHVGTGGTNHGLFDWHKNGTGDASWILLGDASNNWTFSGVSNKANAANITTTTNALAYYTNTTGTFGNASKITVYNDVDITVQSATKKRNGIRLSGTCYGNTASDLTSNTIGVMRYEDGGVRIEFSADSNDNAALLYTNHDGAGPGASLHFVGQYNSDNQGGNLHVTAPNLVARKRFIAGANFVNGNYVLYSNGATYINGNTSIKGNLLFQDVNPIIWDNGTVRQKILITDDSIANTAVFTFQQSSDSGSTYTNLFTILDNKSVATDRYNYTVSDVIKAYTQYNATDDSIDFIFA